MAHIESEARLHSSDLAASRGKFPNWEGSVYADEGVAMRNATVTTVAPTGTISIIAGCSSGIEPFYAISFVRNVMEGTRLVDVNPLFEQVAKERGFYSQELMERIANANSISGFDEIPEDVREVFVTAADVPPPAHIRMQAVFQKHCDFGGVEDDQPAAERHARRCSDRLLAGVPSGMQGRDGLSRRVRPGRCFRLAPRRRRRANPSAPERLMRRSPHRRLNRRRNSVSRLR